MLVAADATGLLAGLEVRQAAHRLDRHPPLVQRLECQGTARRRAEECRAVGLDGHRPEHLFAGRGVGQPDLGRVRMGWS